MVQRDLMSVLMFIEDSTLAASGQPAQEVKNTLGNLVRKIISSTPNWNEQLERYVSQFFLNCVNCIELCEFYWNSWVL